MTDYTLISLPPGRVISVTAIPRRKDLACTVSVTADEGLTLCALGEEMLRTRELGAFLTPSAGGATLHAVAVYAEELPLQFRVVRRFADRVILQTRRAGFDEAFDACDVVLCVDGSVPGDGGLLTTSVSRGEERKVFVNRTKQPRRMNLATSARATLYIDGKRICRTPKRPAVTSLRIPKRGVLTVRATAHRAVAVTIR